VVGLDEKECGRRRDSVADDSRSMRGGGHADSGETRPVRGGVRDAGRNGSVTGAAANGAATGRNPFLWEARRTARRRQVLRYWLGECGARQATAKLCGGQVPTPSAASIAAVRGKSTALSQQ
jgi:hypothetical protein